MEHDEESLEKGRKILHVLQQKIQIPNDDYLKKKASEEENDGYVQIENEVIYSKPRSRFVQISDDLKDRSKVIEEFYDLYNHMKNPDYHYTPSQIPNVDFQSRRFLRIYEANKIIDTMHEILTNSTMVWKQATLNERIYAITCLFRICDSRNLYSTVLKLYSMMNTIQKDDSWNTISSVSELFLTNNMLSIIILAAGRLKKLEVLEEMEILVKEFQPPSQFVDENPSYPISQLGHSDIVIASFIQAYQMNGCFDKAISFFEKVPENELTNPLVESIAVTYHNVSKGISTDEKGIYVKKLRDIVQRALDMDITLSNKAITNILHVLKYETHSLSILDIIFNLPQISDSHFLMLIDYCIKNEERIVAIAQESQENTKTIEFLKKITNIKSTDESDQIIRNIIEIKKERAEIDQNPGIAFIERNVSLQSRSDNNSSITSVLAPFSSESGDESRDVISPQFLEAICRLLSKNSDFRLLPFVRYINRTYFVEITPKISYTMLCVVEDLISRRILHDEQLEKLSEEALENIDNIMEKNIEIFQKEDQALAALRISSATQQELNPKLRDYILDHLHLYSQKIGIQICNRIFDLSLQSKDVQTAEKVIDSFKKLHWIPGLSLFKIMNRHLVADGELITLRRRLRRLYPSKKGYTLLSYIMTSFDAQQSMLTIEHMIETKQRIPLVIFNRVITLLAKEKNEEAFSYFKHPLRIEALQRHKRLQIMEDSVYKSMIFQFSDKFRGASKFEKDPNYIKDIKRYDDLWTVYIEYMERSSRIDYQIIERMLQLLPANDPRRDVVLSDRKRKFDLKSRKFFRNL